MVAIANRRCRVVVQSYYKLLLHIPGHIVGSFHLVQIFVTFVIHNKNLKIKTTKINNSAHAYA